MRSIVLTLVVDRRLCCWLPSAWLAMPSQGIANRRAGNGSVPEGRNEKASARSRILPPLTTILSVYQNANSSKNDYLDLDHPIHIRHVNPTYRRRVDFDKNCPCSSPSRLSSVSSIKMTVVGCHQHALPYHAIGHCAFFCIGSHGHWLYVHHIDWQKLENQSLPYHDNILCELSAGRYYGKSQIHISNRKYQHFCCDGLERMSSFRWWCIDEIRLWSLLLVNISGHAWSWSN